MGMPLPGLASHRTAGLDLLLPLPSASPTVRPALLHFLSMPTLLAFFQCNVAACVTATGSPSEAVRNRPPACANCTGTLAERSRLPWHLRKV